MGESQRRLLCFGQGKWPLPYRQAVHEGDLDGLGFDEKGRPIRPNGMVPTREGTRIYPNNQGGTNWYSPSYSPRTGLFYIPAWLDTWSTFVKQEDQYKEGQRYVAGLRTSSYSLNRRGQINTQRPDTLHCIDNYLRDEYKFDSLIGQ